MLIQIKYKAPRAVRVVLWTTNLILCPDVVHSISFSRNLVTATHRGYYVWWMTRTGIHWSVGWSLTCSLSVFGWRRSLVCRHSRFPLLCTRAPPPPPALPVQSRQHRCHLWFTNTAQSCQFLYTQDTCVCGTLTDLHLLRRTLGVSCVVLRSAVVFARVFFPDGDEFLQCMGMFGMQIYYDKMALNFAHTIRGMHCFSRTQIDFCSWNGLKKELNLGMLFNEWGMESYNLKYTVNGQRGRKHNIRRWLCSQLEGAEEDNLWQVVFHSNNAGNFRY